MPTVSAERFRRPAQYIAARQREHPPRYQSGSGWTALFGGALEFCPTVMRRRVRRGMIAGGEIGELAPIARVTTVGRGYAIEMFSGMMRLIYSATRTIAATHSGQFTQTPQASSLSGAQAATKIRELFENYRIQKIATSQQFPATQQQKLWAHTIAVHAETFLLMHELAHIYNEHSFWRGLFGKKHGDVCELESKADATANRWLIDYVLNPTPGSSQPQMFYAGAEFGLRVRMAMETIGMRFAPTHPKAGHRVASLRAGLRETAGPQKFYAIANTSLAFDHMWRAVEQMLLNLPPVFELELDDVLASMRTLTSELLNGGDINDIVTVRSVDGEPGRMQAMLAPKGPEKIALLNSARDYMQEVTPEIRTAARAHAGDVFERGTLEFSVLLALLNTVQP